MTDLTEQWKKGGLKKNKYWVKYKNGKIDTWELSEEITIESKPEIIEVLAPVPSYEEYQHLKELLKECRDYVVNTLIELKNGYCYEENDYYHETKTLLNKIDNAIGEKK